MEVLATVHRAGTLAQYARALCGSVDVAVTLLWITVAESKVSGSLVLCNAGHSRNLVGSPAVTGCA